MTKAEVEVITSVQTAPALVAGREGKLSAQSVGSEILLVGGAVVSGGAVKIRNGVVEVAASGSENVAFVANGSGGLILDGLGNAYTGRESGFGFRHFSPFGFQRIHCIQADRRRRDDDLHVGKCC